MLHFSVKIKNFLKLLQTSKELAPKKIYIVVVGGGGDGVTLWNNLEMVYHVE